jgi:superkiller protein 3
MEDRKMKQRVTVLFSVAGIICIMGIGIAFGVPTETGKIPITTTSDEARQLFLKGRDLSESLQGQESLQLFDEAVKKDPNFAMGYIYLAFGQPSVQGFFDNLNKAKALADKVSEGEKWYILSTEALAYGLPDKQKEYCQKLVGAFPNDERAHNLLGDYFFGQQQWEFAIKEYNRAVEINPNFSPAYNQLGYCYRSLGDYTKAEEAFRKYVGLVPDDPNPYDSLAELLMKMGKYDSSIEEYQRALSKNPHFVSSFVGMASDLNLEGNHLEARAGLQKLYDIARNDGERRMALLATVVSFVDEGNLDEALKTLDQQYALAEKMHDAAAKSGDLILMGNILEEKGDADQAMQKYVKSVEVVEKSNLSEEVKVNTRRFQLYNAGRIALMKKDFPSAKAHAENFDKQVEAVRDLNQIRYAHELNGIIALDEMQYDKALGELQRANQQDPYNWYRMALAYQGKGDRAKAKECCLKAAGFNALNNLNYAFIRTKAQKMAEGL